MAKKEEGRAESLYKPLLMFYDCEAASGDLFNGDIIEIAARSSPSVIDASFESLIKTEKKLGWFAVEKCGITEDKLLDKPLFPAAMKKFFKWIDKTIRKANRKSSFKYFPVLCAHGGFTFDFIMLLSNMDRNNIDQDILRKINLQFADSFQYCKELQASDLKELCGIRLSMDSLFSTFCPKKLFTNQHRALGDVNAMVGIFSTGPLKDAMDKINYITAETMCRMHRKQFSVKEQKLILEEKMSKLDAYTKCVNVKKLLQIHLTFEGIQSLFENCCSFTDFFEAMKDRDIDRKTAKYFACQFGGLGIKNQGTVPYCTSVKPELEVKDEETHSVYVGDEKAGAILVLEDDVSNNKNYQRPVNVPELPPDEFRIQESSECWEDEMDPNRTFVITLMKPIPALSVTMDEFVSPSSEKCGSQSGTVRKQKRENAQISQRNKRFPKNRNSTLPKLKKAQSSCFSSKQNYKNKKILTKQNTDTLLCKDDFVSKDMCGDATTTDGGTLLKENGEQKQLTSSQDVSDTSSTVHSTDEQYSKEEQFQVACTSSQAQCENKLSQINHNLKNPKACTTDVLQNQSIKKVERSKLACVILGDKEMEDELINWPRVKILVGDIPIYVPVEPSIAEEEDIKQDHVTSSCNNKNIEEEKEKQKAIFEHDFSNDLVSLTCANERHCVSCVSLADLSSESCIKEDSSGRLAMVSNVPCNYPCPMSSEITVTNSNVCQPLCYFEPNTSSTSPSMSPAYVDPFNPHVFYPMNMNQMTAQQMFLVNTNTPGQFFQRPNNPRYAPKMVQEFYSHRIHSYHK